MGGICGAQQKKDLSYEMIENGEMIVFDQGTGNTHVLNVTAAMLFLLIDDISLKDLQAKFYRKINEVLEKMPECDIIIRDVTRMVDGFRRQGIVSGDD